MSTSDNKNVAPEPDHCLYMQEWADIYEGTNYDKGLTGYFLGKSHQWSEISFSRDQHFPRVLEVGAGTGMHLQYVRHSFDEYVLTDLNPPLLDSVPPRLLAGSTGKVSIALEDAGHLSFGESSFDRLVAAHVLEHLLKPHEALREWARVVRPGGVITIVLPCDPGLLWRIGRALVARRKFVRRGFAYDYWMAREHVNAINNLVAFVRYYFRDYKEFWLPTRVPSMDCNLFYIVHITI